MNTIQKKWFFRGSLFLLLLSSCQSKENNISQPENPLIIGRATPIQLNQEETILPIEDYVIQYDRIDSVTSDGPFSIEIIDSNLVISGQPEKPGYSLTFWEKGNGESVLLKRNIKTPYSFSYSGDEEDIKIKGAFNAWNPNNTILEKQDSEYAAQVLLSPGSYEYLFVVDGREIRDPSNKDSVSNGMGGWNSIIEIPGSDKTALPIISPVSFSDNKVSLSSSNEVDRVYVFWENKLLSREYVEIDGNNIDVILPNNAVTTERTVLRVWAANEEGMSNDVLIPLHFGKVLSSPTQISRKDREAMIMYFLMVDRFNNGNFTNDKPLNIPEVHPRVDFLGGDLKGITKKIEDGYFQSLGVNTIWLSPITQNPEGAFGKYPEPKTSFSAYHGYWPISSVNVDYRFGTSEELKELINKAHNSDMNVLLDYVANHVHEQHPVYQQNPDWTTDLYLPDGTLNTEKWDEHRLTTWFDTFLPTLDLSRMETVDPLTDSALFWVKEYGIDGFRHDATKHIPEIFWRVLTKKVKQQVSSNPESPIFQIGETYGSHELIKSYISTGMLDAQFDFNMYDRAVSAFAEEGGSLINLANSLIESLKYYGDHNQMGYITGNQDRPRFISYADGSLKFGEDTKYAGWNRRITIQDTLAYQKLSALTAYMMVIPGIPCIYYGDEYGSPGGNDPDNRRPMRFHELDRYQKSTLLRTKKLIALRKNNLALIYGNTEIIQSSQNKLVISRKYFGNQVIAVFNTSGQELEESIPAGGSANFYGQVNGSKVSLPPYSFDIITYN
ncbi:MAG: alpha-amylase family glycosyl hydrolase [Cyclobacteriaceae bacterium]